MFSEKRLSACSSSSSSASVFGTSKAQSCLHNGQDADFMVSHGSIRSGYDLMSPFHVSIIVYLYIHSDTHDRTVICELDLPRRIHPNK